VAINGTSAGLRLLTLGSLRLVDADGRDVGAGQRKLLALLAYLAVEAPHAPTREQLATLMWGERRDENARASLRQALFQLKRLVGPTLDVAGEVIALRTDAIEVDVTVLQNDVARGDYRAAVLRWNGEFLAGADDVGGESYRTWLDAERARVRELVARALDAVTSEASARGAWAEAASWAERWTYADPLAEGPARRLVEALSLAGRGAEALARHAAFVARHRAELGVGPSEDFVRLGARLERRARATEVNPARGAAALLPSEFVGRGDAFHTLTTARRDARTAGPIVVIIEGEVGAGKSRLVEELVRSIVSERSDELVLLHTVADATDSDTPLATARRLLSRLADAPGLLGAPPAALADLAVVVPSIAEHLAGLPARPLDRPLDDGIARVLTDVAAEAPIVVALDDVAYADAESRRLLFSVLRRIRSAPIVCFLTTEPGGVRATEELRGAGSVRRIKLTPLQMPDVELLLASMLRFAPESRREAAQRIVAQVGSYPLDVVETLTTLVDREYLAPDGTGTWRLVEHARGERIPLAATLRAAIGRRIDSLDENARLVLEAAAVAPASTNAPALARFVNRESESVADSLEELTRRRLVRAAPSSDSTASAYEISSEWIRRVVAERIPADRRAALRAGGAHDVASMLSPPGDRWLERLESRYEIGAVIAEGKLVSMLEARERGSGRPLVLHVLHGGAPIVGPRFMRTLERVAALSHPGVVPLLDFGGATDASFYATPRMGAPSLRERLTRERPLGVEEAVRIGIEVGHALAAAHECEILHGDLRPKHILLTADGAKVAGVGIVQALGGREGPGGPEGTGVTIGAPAYLSPEQLSGESAADARSDIYSLGCVLYEMLVGELPFGGSNRSVIARKLTQAAPSVRARRESLPKQVDRVVRTCLDRVPADRYRTMAEVVEELGKVSEALGL
jgi:serine/threonine-protein kinase